MDYSLYFSTVGLFLDIMVLSSLVFANLGEYKFLNKCKLYVPIFIAFKILEPLKHDYTILFYAFFYIAMLIVSRLVFKFKPWNFFIFITSFVLFVVVDTFVYMNFEGFAFLISTTLYKVIFIYFNENYQLPNLENENVLVNKMLTNLSVSALIVISIFLKEVM